MSGRTYNATDFKRYYSGTMPAAERHALEKAALEDAFLADALEGFSFSADPESETTDLKNGLNTQLKNNKKNNLFIAALSENWLRIAALFVLLAGVGWVLFNALPSNQKTEMAVEKPIKKGVAQQMEAATAVQDSASTVAAVASPVENEASQKPVKKGINEAKPIERETSLNNSEISIAASTQSRVLLGDTISNVQVFSGKVVDATGNPLPLATVKAKNATTATDLSGRFKIAAPDSPLTATVSAAGFEANKLQLGAPAQNTVVLQELAAASKRLELADNRTKKALKRGTTGENAQVKGGLEAFNLYVAQNKKLEPKIASEFGGRSVLLLFDVDSAGTPVNIKVDQPLCTACDAEAIRLLQTGPKWSAGKGRVVITF